ncbi:MAG TPA: thioredoxin domain-containing protein [Thermoanaerobaculia bacterium]|nr:thioredoxin domain-containing protein [Thermoanaerobaculia bacterium]
MTTTLSPCPDCHALNRVDLERADQQSPVCGRCRAALPLRDGVTSVRGDALQAAIRSAKLPVVVDFWAPWCGPCRAFAPVFSRAARTHGDSAVFLKLDTEQDPAAAQAYRIQAIPTLVGYREGREVGRRAGALPAPALDEFVASLSA